jgi:hypothetical protein
MLIVLVALLISSPALAGTITGGWYLETMHGPELPHAGWDLQAPFFTPPFSGKSADSAWYFNRTGYDLNYSFAMPSRVSSSNGYNLQISTAVLSYGEGVNGPGYVVLPGMSFMSGDYNGNLISGNGRSSVAFLLNSAGTYDFHTLHIDFNQPVVVNPEPSSVLLFGTGIAAVWYGLRKRNKTTV